jgi:hypothetical protein
VPKRVIDADAMWSSDKLAACAEWAQAEYAWLYGLADASGSFELTNLRVIWGRVAAIRRNFTIERLEQVFDEFGACGLLFRWESSGKRYGYWTGSDVPGRLPAPSWRVRLEKLAPPVPRKELAEYVARFSRGAKQEAAQHAADRSAEYSAERETQRTSDRETQFARQGTAQGSTVCSPAARSVEASSPTLSALKPRVEVAQAQDLNLNWNQNRDWNQRPNPNGNVERRLPFPQPSASRTKPQANSNSHSTVNHNSVANQSPTPDQNPTADENLRNNSSRDDSDSDDREVAERALAQTARSLDPWASRTARTAGNHASSSHPVGGRSAPIAGGSRGANQRRVPPAQPAWWQLRQDAKALQLARELNVGRGPELPPRRAPRDASGEKAEALDETASAKGAANGR